MRLSKTISVWVTILKLAWCMFLKHCKLPPPIGLLDCQLRQMVWLLPLLLLTIGVALQICWIQSITLVWVSEWYMKQNKATGGSRLQSLVDKRFTPPHTDCTIESDAWRHLQDIKSRIFQDRQNQFPISQWLGNYRSSSCLWDRLMLSSLAIWETGKVWLWTTIVSR